MSRQRALELSFPMAMAVTDRNKHFLRMSGTLLERRLVCGAHPNKSNMRFSTPLSKVPAITHSLATPRFWYLNFILADLLLGGIIDGLPMTESLRAFIRIRSMIAWNCSISHGRHKPFGSLTDLFGTGRMEQGCGGKGNSISTLSLQTSEISRRVSTSSG